MNFRACLPVLVLLACDSRCPDSLQGLTATSVCLTESVGLRHPDGEDLCSDMPTLGGVNQCPEALTFPRGFVVAPDESFSWLIDRQFEAEESGARRFAFPVMVGARSETVSFVLR
jgi:hypothetical protein